ncbi:hypothetical protein GCM10023168_27790 [Fodinibacter luteus]|uniref:Uncharacterized protein n=1 Tax=Fodinibacter luteus TaxID=552064 RepID=A0ABP8KKI2_9MICO
MLPPGIRAVLPPGAGAVVVPCVRAVLPPCVRAVLPPGVRALVGVSHATALFQTPDPSREVRATSSAQGRVRP